MALEPIPERSFDSFEEAKQFAESWAKEHGYTVVTERLKNSKLGYLRQVWLCCGVEGSADRRSAARLAALARAGQRQPGMSTAPLQRGAVDILESRRAPIIEALISCTSTGSLQRCLISFRLGLLIGPAGACPALPFLSPSLSPRELARPPRASARPASANRRGMSASAPSARGVRA
jgi:hypothetical protein